MIISGLIGQRSYGKGLVQQTRPLAYNSQLKVTTAKYYIPSGRCIQAIDYSHRNPDGSVGKIPDSLMVEFKTQAGRKVYDGGGVTPDIEVEDQDYAPIIYGLIKDDLIFDYVTEYVYSHSEITDPKKLDLTDAEYAQFVDWLKDKELSYTTQVERDIDKLIASAKKEQYYNEIEEQILNLKQETLHNKDSDLITFKSDIKSIIEQEIAGRYYYQAGMIESTFDEDPDIQKAVEVLSDQSKYQEILKGN